MSVYLALTLKRPLFLEGEAGVGKTEVAKVLASALGARLIRLQCYEGLDVSQAVYEWNYSRQLLHIRLLEASGGVDREGAERELFSEEFLIKRPLLQALDGDAGPTVLLIDELDRADEEFEGYLLEMLSDFQITIPEIGTYTAGEPPVVVITSNRTREIHGRPQAAVPVLLDRLPGPRKRDADCEEQGPLGVPDAGRPGRRLRPRAADDRAVQGPRRSRRRSTGRLRS